jgi:hypothetical protein
VECTWVEHAQGNHEINLLFEVQVPDLDLSEAPASQESHLEFIWADLADLRTYNLLPEPIIGCLMNWDIGFRGYWGSAFEKTAAASVEQAT